jgi:hypothetical protein
MKFIKLFEEIEDNSQEFKRIKEAWSVEPWDFFDIMSSKYERALISFGFDYRYSHSQAEIKICFYLDENGIKKGPYYDKFDLFSISRMLDVNLSSKKYKPIIEVYVDVFAHKGDKEFENNEADNMNNLLMDLKIPYKLEYIDYIGEALYLLFEPTNVK